jgi:hypothetical protein
VATKVCKSKPSSTWAANFAQECLHGASAQCGLSEAEKARLGQHIASEIGGSNVHSPYRTYVTVPNCDGLVYATCAKQLEEAGLEPHREDLNWSKVETLKPNEVQELVPAKSSEVVKGTGVKVITNPQEADMPVVIPRPEREETYTHYIGRLSPALSPERVIVADPNVNATAGPAGVLSTQPAAGTQLNPHTQHAVEVQTNPDTLPSGAVGGGVGSCNASVGSINWSPLNQPLGSKFPFGIFGFFVGWIGGWGIGSATPEWAVHLTHSLVLHINLAVMAPVVEVVRVAILFASFVGLLWFLGTAAAKLQGDSS